MSDEVYFEGLIKRFSSYIRNLVQKYNPQGLGFDEEDLVQKIRIRLWKNVSSEKSIQHLSSYIKKTVNSVVIDHIRERRKQARIIEQQKEHFDQEILSEEDESEYMSLIKAELEELEPSKRRILKYHFLGLNFEEIAGILGWNPDKTRNVLYRSLNEFKANLKEKIINYED